uniref:Uncharacterized protein n=1 Tax=viral metagenome TaxID=1070528 RepID=A0A6C0HGW2_9ZZZZ
MDKVYFNLENENGFYSVYFFLLSSYIYACKTNKILCIKDDKWKFLYKNGLDDYFLLDKKILKYSSINNNNDNDNDNNNDNDKNIIFFCHSKEPNMLHTLHEYKLYSKELYTCNPDIIQNFNLPEKYNSIFIRGGDKLLYEATQHPISHYVFFLLKLNIDTNNVFVHSDDNNLVESVEKYITDNNINLKVYKITDKSNNGGAVVMKRLNYGDCKNIKSVDDMSNEEKKNHTVKMLNAIEIMRHSVNVILSYDSNVSRFIKLNFDCNVYSINHSNNLDYNSPTKNPAYSF